MSSNEKVLCAKMYATCLAREVLGKRLIYRLWAVNTKFAVEVGAVFAPLQGVFLVSNGAGVSLLVFFYFSNIAYFFYNAFFAVFWGDHILFARGKIASLAPCLPCPVLPLPPFFPWGRV